MSFHEGPAETLVLREPTTRNSSVVGKGNKAIVVGLYGVSGCGKSYMLSQLKAELDHERFAFYEGSEVIARLLPGGLDELSRLDNHKKQALRERAIQSIRDESLASSKVAIATGHFMFWAEEDTKGESVCTWTDMDIYTNVLYLNVAADKVSERRKADTLRNRVPVSTAHIREWQKAEAEQLGKLCRQNGILFSIVPDHLASLDKVLAILRFHIADEASNAVSIAREVDNFTANQHRLQTALVFDGDRTLAAEDTGKIFWMRVAEADGLDEWT